jgi:ABC-type branched-subunit amino acid transport system substrate-binding protein
MASSSAAGDCVSTAWHARQLRYRTASIAIFASAKAYSRFGRLIKPAATKAAFDIRTAAAGITALTVIVGGAWYFLHAPPVRGMTDNEIRFGISAPFTGSANELGNQTKLGIETSFNLIHDAGGINGRQLRLVAAEAKDSC